MATRKDQKEELRAQRLAAQKREEAEARRRLLLGYGIAGLLGAAVLVGLVLVLINSDGGGGGQDASDFPADCHINPATGIVPENIACDDREGTPPPEIELADLDEAAEAAGCEVALDLDEEGNEHIPPSAKDPEYETDPPTSGDHSPNQLADGAYAEMPEPRNFVHTLEHGRIEIQYSPDLSEPEQLVLKGVFDEDPRGMVIFPNTEMEAEVAITAWQNMVTCEEYAPEVVDVIRAFRDDFRGFGPEPVGF